MAFLSIQGYVLQFSVALYFANSQPSPAPSTAYSLHLCAASLQTSSLLGVNCGYGSHGRDRKVSWPLTTRYRDLSLSATWETTLCVRKLCVWFLFRAPLMNCASAQQAQCVGAEEDCWLWKKTFHAFLCLSDAARRSAFRGTRLRGEGDGNIVLRRCGGTD